MNARKTKKYEPKEMERFLDVRVRDRYVDDGTITAKQVDKHLAGLPDSADAAEYVDLPIIGDRDEDEQDSAAAEAEAAKK